MKAYFVFLRYLVYMNLLHCIVIWGFILWLVVFYGRSPDSGGSAVMMDKFTTQPPNRLPPEHSCVVLCDFTEPLSYGDEDSLLDFFLGTVSDHQLVSVRYVLCTVAFSSSSFLQGYVDRSPAFYGYYTPGSLNFPCLNTPLLYVAGILTILFLSLIMVVRRSVSIHLKEISTIIPCIQAAHVQTPLTGR